MRLQTQAGYFVTGAATLALLAGCSGSGSQAVTPTAPIAQQQQSSRPLSFSRDITPTSFAARPEVQPLYRPVQGLGYVSPDVDAVGGAAEYAADYGASTVTVFSAAGKQTAQLTSSNGISNPQGMAGDAAGNVYIANTGASNILVYSAGLKKVVKTLTDTSYYPTGVSIASTGVVGVANILNINGSSAGNVVFYAKGGTTPCATVSDPNWQRVYFGAFDDKGNLYIDGQNPSGSTLLGVIAGGCKAKKITTLTGATITFPGGMQVAPNDDILIDDQGSGSGSTVYTYKPPVRNAYGAPVATTPLTGTVDGVTISLNGTSKDVWAADASSSPSYIGEFAYTKGGAALKKLSPTGVTQVIGVFVSPQEQP